MKCLLFLLALVPAACTAGTVESPPASPSTPVWQRSTPEAQGLDSRVFVEGLRRVRDEGIDLHSLIVIRNGHLVLEAYVHPYDRETLHNVKSVSKSVMSAVVGIALERGILEDLDQPVYDLLPEYFPDDAEAGKKRITLRHLLTMTAGLDLDENGPLMSAVFRSEDWVRATFARPMIQEPGGSFVYSTPLSHAMSVILAEASGKSLLDLTRELLFEPIGIEQARWKTDPRGYHVGGADLYLRPLDMAKFGQLFIDRGRWQGWQVVPEEWVVESTRNQLEDIQQTYGYWWWPQGEGGYVASGWGGQAIQIMPSIGLIAVGTATVHGAIDQMFRGFEDYEPSDEALPPNPAAVAEMESLVRELGSPPPGAVSRRPAIADVVSGSSFAMEENPQKVTRFRFDFPAGHEARLEVTTAEGEVKLSIGLDGVYRIVETGSYGSMPGNDNRFAMRGAWTGDRTFELETIELGNPVQARALVTFTEDTIEIEMAMRPLGRTVRLKGVAERPPESG